jgi:surface polysaccharide O-acyltransferase-like enzyme
VLWIFASSISPLIFKLSEIPNRMDLMTVGGFSGYFVLGLLLGNLNITKKKFIIAGITYLASLIVTILGAYQLTVKGGGVLSEYFYGWHAPNVILASASAFVLIKYSALKFKLLLNENVLMIAGALSSASLGIYLVHIIFLELLQKGRLGVTISSLQGHPILSIPWTAMAILLLSYSVVAVLQKIPLLRKTVP